MLLCYRCVVAEKELHGGVPRRKPPQSSIPGVWLSSRTSGVAQLDDDTRMPKVTGEEELKLGAEEDASARWRRQTVNLDGRKRGRSDAWCSFLFLSFVQ